MGPQRIIGKLLGSRSGVICCDPKLIRRPNLPGRCQPTTGRWPGEPLLHQQQLIDQLRNLAGEHFRGGPGRWKLKPPHRPTHRRRGYKSLNRKPLVLLVPEARLELAQGCPRGILSPLRLPIPPLRQQRYFSSFPTRLARGGAQFTILEFMPPNPKGGRSNRAAACSRTSPAQAA